MSAGRGKDAVLPSWMTKEPNFGADSHQNHSIPQSNNNNHQNRYEDNVTRDSGREDKSRDERRDRDDKDRGRNRDHDRDRERDRKDKDRDRNRDRERDRDDRRRSHSKQRSRSRRRNKSPEPVWKPKIGRPSNFDVLPPNGVELPPIGSAGLGEVLGYNNVHGPPRDLSANTRHARRIYVGGIPVSVTEADITNFFNDFVIKNFPATLIPQGGYPVVGVFLNVEKCFAFVEFPSMEMATAFMKLDGMQMTVRHLSNCLKIKRPHDYKPELVPTSCSNLSDSVLESISNILQPSNRLFVANIPNTLDENQVQSILSAFGPLKTFNLVRDLGATVSKGYAFCEYADEMSTNGALYGLNMLELAGKKLVAKFADRGNGNQAAQQQLHQHHAQILGQYQTTNPSTSSTSAVSSSTSMPASRVLRLTNMVTVEEIQDDSIWREIIDDTAAECYNYGNVVRVVVPRAKDGYDGEGQVFVEFSDVHGAAKAMANLDGRKFDGRPVGATYFSEEDFNNGRYGQR